MIADEGDVHEKVRTISDIEPKELIVLVRNYKRSAENVNENQSGSNHISDAQDNSLAHECEHVNSIHVSVETIVPFLLMIIVDPDLQHVVYRGDQVDAHKCKVCMVSNSLLQETPIYFFDFLGLIFLAESLVDL